MKVYYKMPETLVQNPGAILLQNAAKVYHKMCQLFISKVDTFITKCNSFYKMQRLYYKMRQLVQNPRYYKIRRHRVLSSQNNRNNKY